MASEEVIFNPIVKLNLSIKYSLSYRLTYQSLTVDSNISMFIFSNFALELLGVKHLTFRNLFLIYYKLLFSALVLEVFILVHL
jgi:hypothetical protein